MTRIFSMSPEPLGQLYIYRCNGLPACMTGTEVGVLEKIDHEFLCGYMEEAYSLNFYGSTIVSIEYLAHDPLNGEERRG